LLTIHVELDTEGTIPPDDDPPQEMGDRSVEVTEDMRDKAQEERQQGSMAMAEGVCNDTRNLASSPGSPIFSTHTRKVRGLGMRLS
jgi:suppressor of tumorigenicity protein 13